MRHWWLVLLAACSAPTVTDTSPSLAVGSPQARAYIVSLARGANPNEIAHAHGVSPRFVYRYALTGFAATIPEAAVEGLRRNPRVLSIEPDGIVSMTATASWGLDRIDQRTLPLDDAYLAPNDGAGVRVYILDTGVRYTHPELAGRVAQGTDIIGGDENADDCQGHGTHVAGTVAGLTVGVARAATIVAVRMLNCAGSATDAEAIAGIEWVIGNRILPAVANASWGGSRSVVLDQAMAALVASGVTVAAAAGNSSTDACGFSPAAEPSLLTVAASTITDTRAGFSNFGGCVDLFAPGAVINSSLITGGYGTKSGTSMASPHVAGVAALYLAANPLASPATVMQAVLGGATTGQVSDVMDSPNRLAYSGIAGPGVLPPLPPPPLPEPVGVFWVADLDDVSEGSVKGQWWARVRVQLIAEDGGPVEGFVEGRFFVTDKQGERHEETGLCTTDQTGVCQMVATIPNKYSSSRMTLVRVTGRDGATYDPTRNTDPDGDSDGNTITVRKP